jgi:hypothetical protein
LPWRNDALQHQRPLRVLIGQQAGHELAGLIVLPARAAASCLSLHSRDSQRSRGSMQLPFVCLDSSVRRRWRTGIGASARAMARGRMGKRAVRPPTSRSTCNVLPRNSHSASHISLKTFVSALCFTRSDRSLFSALQEAPL